jgi:hypothetical protein
LYAVVVVFEVSKTVVVANAVVVVNAVSVL